MNQIIETPPTAVPVSLPTVAPLSVPSLLDFVEDPRDSGVGLETSVALTNPLFPAFLKLHRLRTLVLGGGAAALLRLRLILASSPSAQVTVVSRTIDPAFGELLTEVGEHRVILARRGLTERDIRSHDVALIARESKADNARRISQLRAHRLLINVADDPDESDFALGSILTRGALKVAVSSAGMAIGATRQLRDELGKAMPDGLQSLMQALVEV